jgi:hypothetical protein
MLISIVVTVLIGSECTPTATYFVLAGQSNMIGHSTLPKVLGADSLTYHPDDYWKDTVDPLHYPPDNPATSAWPTFAIAWWNALGYRSNFIATAVAGSALVWTPDENIPGCWDPTIPYCTHYQNMLSQITEALLSTNQLRAVLWLQGETDSGVLPLYTSDPYTVYKNKLKILADHIWADLGVPLVVAPISLNMTHPSFPAHRVIPIHDATIDAAIEHPHILLGPSTDDLEMELDGIHIHDVITLGNRWFEAIQSLGLAY